MNIEKLEFQIPIFVSHLECHDELKSNLLNVIDNIEAPAVEVQGTPIARSSFGNPAINQKWRPMFMKAARRHLAELYKELQTPHWEVVQMWFQTYVSGNLHRAHTHGAFTWANVYYLELPGPQYGTVFYHPARHWVELRGHLKTDTSPVLRPKVKEGDIVTFPGYLEHEAPLVSGEHRKTIVSFNVQAVQPPSTKSDT